MSFLSTTTAKFRCAWFFGFILWAVVGTSASPEVRVNLLESRVWRADFHSAALDRDMRFLVILPQGSAMSSAVRMPVIYFLHGRGRDEMTLLSDDFLRHLLLASRCAIVLPRGEDGWYVDSPVVSEDRYAAYLDEVIAAAEENFPLRQDMAGRAIGGWSMGGYGAAYTFTRRYGDFAALATIIGILDYPREEVQPVDQNYPVQPRFGNDHEAWRRLNPRWLLSAEPKRPLFVAYADRAPERQMNEAFIGEARSLGLSVTEMRIPGEHVFAVVREALPAALYFLELQLIPEG
jgi:S-formylglutathione hydrolase FrmB